MISTTYTRARALSRSRWGAILGAAIIPTILAVALAIYGASLLISAALDAALSGVSTSVSFGETAAEPSSGSLASTVFGGAAVALGIATGYLVLSMVAMLAGVTAATGRGAFASLGWAARRAPNLLVQVIVLGWPLLAAAVGVVVLAVVGIKVGIGLSLAIIAVPWVVLLQVRVGSLMALAVGSIAHGNQSYGVTSVRAAARGREWDAAGASIVGVLIGIAVAYIPIVGPFLQVIWMSAYISAMWEQFGGQPAAGPHAAYPSGAAPAAPGAGPGGWTGGTAAGHAAPAPGSPAAASGSSTEALMAAVAAGSAMPGHAGIPIAAPVVATPNAAAMPSDQVPGPTWHAVADPTAPAAAWLQFERPSRVAVVAEWTGGPAPALRVADERGTWTTPRQQPTTSGQPIWLDLPAGLSWVAFVPHERQELWCASSVPSGTLLASSGAFPSG